MTKKQPPVVGKDFFNEQYLPIITAIDNQDKASLTSLVNLKNINTIGNSNLTFVFYSFYCKYKKSFKWLIDHGADVNIPFKTEETKFTYLINIATKLDDPYFFESLLPIADLNVKDEKGFPPTHNAISVANFERLNLLLDKGANINITDKDNQTPLFFLCLIANYKQAYTLLMRGADPRIPDVMGNTIAYIIQLNNLPPSSEAFIWQKKIKIELIKQGINFPARESN